jgi:hypothetical protein
MLAILQFQPAGDELRRKGQACKKAHFLRVAGKGDYSSNREVAILLARLHLKRDCPDYTNKLKRKSF